MDKWNAVKNSTVARLAGSAVTLTAVAALAGAGFKWI